MSVVQVWECVTTTATPIGKSRWSTAGETGWFRRASGSWRSRRTASATRVSGWSGWSSGTPGTFGARRSLGAWRTGGSHVSGRPRRSSVHHGHLQGVVRCHGHRQGGHGTSGIHCDCVTFPQLQSEIASSAWLTVAQASRWGCVWVSWALWGSGTSDRASVQPSTTQTALPSQTISQGVGLVLTMDTSELRISELVSGSTKLFFLVVVNWGNFVKMHLSGCLAMSKGELGRVISVRRHSW